MAEELKAGRYLIVRELGHGGMGYVYLARDQKLGRLVALKMLPPEVMHDVELRRRLEQEARAASALNHPGIATVHDYVEAAGESFIVYEYVEGRNLRESIGRRRSSSEEILDLSAQLADAVAHAHERGITHRDLKPENIMLVDSATGFSRLKILDFGLAKIHEPIAGEKTEGLTTAETKSVHTSRGVRMGTVDYMSPEQLAAEPADARSDIFTLGLVLYEVASGINPFVGRSLTSTITNILTLDPPPLSERSPIAPPELDRYVRKCLRKRPAERYQSARELLVDLNNLRSDSKTPAALPAAAKDLREMERPLEISRNTARALLAAIQMGYLAMYAAAVVNLDEIQRLADLLSSSSGKLVPWSYPLLAVPAVLVLALCGTAVRLYLLSALSLDYSDLGPKYRKLFPPALFLDIVWAVAPLLLFEKVGTGPALIFVVGLAYLPFTQRPLLYSAYSSHGGRTSGIRTAGAS